MRKIIYLPLLEAEKIFHKFWESSFNWMRPNESKHSKCDQTFITIVMSLIVGGCGRVYYKSKSIYSIMRGDTESIIPV